MRRMPPSAACRCRARWSRPDLPLEVTTDVENAGPGVFSGAAELLIDDEPATGSPQVVGPIPAGRAYPVHFRTSLSQPGSHLLAVRLLGGDGLAADDVRPACQVAGAIPVLLVNGEPGAEPFSGETDFLRARTGAERRRDAAVSRSRHQA